jgi:DNA-binding GntR family transcriptional regulator
MKIAIRMHNTGGELDARQVDMTHVNPEDPAEVSEAIKDALRDMIDEAVLEPGDTISVEAS